MLNIERSGFAVIAAEPQLRTLGHPDLILPRRLPNHIIISLP